MVDGVSSGEDGGDKVTGCEWGGGWEVESLGLKGCSCWPKEGSGLADIFLR
jgi:hypothetical protein